jgi:anhydro-N-acetylmuramic acid kinase
MSGKQGIWALGAMSGTSLDGVDAALVRTDGETIFEFGETGYRAYTEAERSVLRSAFGKTSGDAVERAAELVETAHAKLLSQFSEAALIGFHGQTLHHAPADGVTVQAGDGEILAEVLGLPVVWDFRRADVEMGGQGAPLAPFFHHACARHIGADAPLGVLNLGGVGNLSWVDPRVDDPAADGALLAFDTGPANAPLDDLMNARLGKSHDADGALARKGRVNDPVIERLLASPYFFKRPPKSLDRNDFAWLGEAVETLPEADAAATLCAAVAVSCLKAMEHCPSPPSRLLVGGGGRKNPVIMEMIQASMDCPVAPVEDVGLDGDMLEAQAFGYLAVRILEGLPTSAPGTTGIATPIGGGHVSRPKTA